MPWDPHRRQRVVTAIAVAAGAAVLAPVAWSAAFHCDETTVLRHLTTFALGDVYRPGRPGLLWLVLAPLTWLGDPVTIARGARVVGWLAATGTLAMAAVLATSVVRAGAGADGDAAAGDDAAGLWAAPAAVVLLVGAMAWHGHGWELRTDTFTTPLTLLLAWRLWRAGTSTREAVLLGLLVGALGLISQKCIYNVAAVTLGYGAWVAASPAPREWPSHLRTLAVVAAVSIGAVVAWYGALALLSGEGAALVSAHVDSAVRTGFADDRDLGAKGKALWGAVRFGKVTWGLAAVGLVVAAVRARRRPGLLAVAVAALAMIGTIAVHRGYFLYYVASFEPLVAVLAAAPVGWALAAARRRTGRLGVPAALGIAALVAVAVLGADRRAGYLAVSNDRQLAVMAAAAEAFPEPVPYWDQLGLVAGYPETTFFGTAEVRKRFRARVGTDAFIKQARERKPRFFVRNYLSRDTYLNKREIRWHWRHFVPYRDNLYLLGGRRLATAAGAGKTSRMEVLVPGEYTVWFLGGWDGEASVGGRSVRHGDVISLNEGEVELDARPTAGEGQLWVLLGAGRVPAAERSADHVDWSMGPLASRNRYQHYDRSNKPGDLRTPPEDPTVGAAEDERRERRHRRWQRKRDERSGTPRQGR